MNIWQFSRTFDDVSYLEDQVQKIGFNSSITQISRGKLESQLLMLKLGDLTVLRANFNQVMAIQGAKPLEHLVFAFTLQQKDKPLLAHGKEIPPDYLYGLNPTLERDLVTPTMFQMAVILVPQSFFWNMVRQMGRDDLKPDKLTQNWLKIHPPFLSSLQTYLHQLCYLGENNQNLLAEINHNILIQADFLPLLIDTLANSFYLEQPYLSYRCRVELVKEAEKWIQDHLDEPITLEDIYKAINTSKRTLIYGFKDIFGISPMQYVKIQRLKGVRRALIAANTEEVTISKVAREYGFWSGGHFCRDYRIMFGESPSETLRGCLKSLYLV